MEIFIDTALNDLLWTLSICIAKRQLELWHLQKEQRNRTSRLLQSLGKSVTAIQAKQLDTLNLHYATLCEIWAASVSSDQFQGILLQRGVRSRPLREKLAAIFN